MPLGPVDLIYGPMTIGVFLVCGCLADVSLLLMLARLEHPTLWSHDHTNVSLLEHLQRVRISVTSLLKLVLSSPY
jgi:hypothetical protein